MHIVGVHEDRIFRLPDADVLVNHVAHQTTSTRVRLDANSIVCSVDRQIRNTNRIRAAIGFAADGYAVSGVEMIVRDGHVRAWPLAFTTTLSSPV